MAVDVNQAVLADEPGFVAAVLPGGNLARVDGVPDGRLTYTKYGGSFRDGQNLEQILASGD